MAGLLDELPPDLVALLAPLRHRGLDDATIEAELIREARAHAAGQSPLNIGDWRTGNVPAILRLYRIILEWLEAQPEAGEPAAPEAQAPFGGVNPPKKKPPFDTQRAIALLIAQKVAGVWKEAPSAKETGDFLRPLFNGIPSDKHRAARHKVWPGLIHPGPKPKKPAK